MITAAQTRYTPCEATHFEATTVAFEQVLGTTFELTVLAPDDLVDAAVTQALTTIDTLEAVFSRFDAGSELRRWLRGEVGQPSHDLSIVVNRALYWTKVTGGAFHFGAEAMRREWARAEAHGHCPDPLLLSRLVEQMRVSDGDVMFGLETRDGERMANLDAIAKGYIADCVATTIRSIPGVSGVIANLGGDIRVSSQHVVSIALPHPMDAFERAHGVDHIEMSEGAIATSGVRVRGFHIEGRWYPHLIDPRNGGPVERIVGATVVAPSCMDADALATAFCVLQPSESIKLADQVPGVACRIHQRDGHTLFSDTYASSVFRAPSQDVQIGFEYAHI